MNIRRSGDKWQGLRVLQVDRSFCQFETMAYGWRAAFRLLCRTYYGKYKLRTIRDIITRWAPPKENDTEVYIRRVTDRIGIGSDRELGDPATHPTQWMMIGIAMAIVENGTANINSIPMLKGWEMSRDDV